LVVAHFSIVVVAPWNNPNSYWLEDINCGDVGTYEVRVANNHSLASLSALAGA
jgi:hypothetical protein